MDLDRVARREIRRRIDRDAALRQAHRHPEMLGVTHLCGFGASPDESNVDPYWSSVQVALHFDGTDGSTTFTDVKGHSMTSIGSPTISTARSKFGGASGLFDSGLSQALSLSSTDLYATGAFTIDFWIYPTNTNCEFASATTGVSNTWEIYLPNSTTLDFRINNEISPRAAQWTGSDLTNGWHYIEVTRDGSDVNRIFVDGVLGSTSNTRAASFDGGSFVLYLMRYFGSGYYVNGNMDDFRYTPGVARHTTGYSVPTAAFPETA